MPERKQLTVWILIFLLIAQWLLPLAQFWPTLTDPEWEQAYTRADNQNIPEKEETKKYPFSTVTRMQAARRFVRFANLHWFKYTKQPIDCQFTDLPKLSLEDQKIVTESCLLGFFKGFMGEFVPNDPMTKASTTVVVARILSPDKTFPDVKEFRNPYLEEGVRLGILKKPEHPYLMYPISRYELLLMLRRTHQVMKKNRLIFLTIIHHFSIL